MAGGGRRRPMGRQDSPGGGPFSREALPPRVRRAGVEPGPRQVVQGVRAAQGAERSAERGAAAGGRRRQRRAAAGTGCASRLPAAEPRAIRRSPPRQPRPYLRPPSGEGCPPSSAEPHEQ
ncbi:unnamed protein product [Rangifer tarandus platyrhynchus]|uniref:Uncharacterized protein n=1 Tax=Rangifer tarandus platyrhynchus TaxID=3082113 RepID=A0ACB1KH81_RANTA